MELLRDILWGPHTLFFILSAGVFFTFKSRFLQVRLAGKWLKAPFAGQDKKGGMSAFQGLTAALGGSIGTGNIVGVAAAITAGGAGAVFWMWISAFFGMMTVYTENLLSAKHNDLAGPLGYIRRVRRVGSILAAVYAAGCFLSSLGMGNMVQSNACAAALESFHVPVFATGICLAALMLFVGRGGLKAAVRITEKLVPLMTVIFVAASLGVLFVFRENILPAFCQIFKGAFSKGAGVGASIGWLTAARTGISRGVFTNEAGLGSSSFAYSEVRGKTPREIGYMGIFQVFLDTIVMCTLTSLCILVCRSPVLEGAKLTFFAFSSAFGDWGGGIVSLCTALFGAATLVSWCCYGREGLFYLTGRTEAARNIYAVFAAAAAFIGCTAPLSAVFTIGDAFNGLMAIPNVIALYFLSVDVNSNAMI